MTKLDNWAITVRCDDSPFTAPECRYEFFALTGKVSGHPFHPDGKKITTSEIISIRLIPGTTRGEAETRSRWYELGEVGEDWMEWLEENGYSMWDYINEIGEGR